MIKYIYVYDNFGFLINQSNIGDIDYVSSYMDSKI